MSRIARIVPTRIYSNPYNVTVLNESNMFTNTDSETYATLTQSSTTWTQIYVGGFNFNQIPTSASVSSVKVIFKLATELTEAMSNTTKFRNKTSDVGYAFSIRYPASSEGAYISERVVNGITLAQMREYGDNLSLPVKVFGTDDTYVYGIEIKVEYDLPINKVVYGTTVLVDLTEDTVTPDDLSEGVTAHDKSGGLITGTNPRGIMVIRDSSDSHGGTVRTITSGEAQVGGMTEADLKKFIQRDTTFTDIDWPEGLTKIGGYAFAGSSQFNPASLPDSVTSIGINAFYSCSSLTLTSLPDSVTYIGGLAFQNCTELLLASLPSGITRIEASAFNNCYKLPLTSLPSGITRIDSSAFSNCYDLQLSELPDGVISIGSSAFTNCESIGSIACDGLITTLGSSAFIGSSYHPMSLTSASFPNMALTSNMVTVFGSTSAANACQQLSFCDIGSTVGIGPSAFANCYALQTLVLRKTNAVCTLQNVSAFFNTPMRGYNSLTGTVYVPQALIESYKTATNWSMLYNDGTVTFVAIEGSKYERE